MKKQTDEEIVKTTIRLPRLFWDAVRRRAIDERSDLQDLVLRALKDYLSKKTGGRK